MRVDKNSHEACAIVLDERFDVTALIPFRKNYESIRTVAGGEVHIDFTHTQYIDSSALGMLINAQSYFSEADCRVKLINASDAIKKVFSASRIDKSFDIN